MKQSSTHWFSASPLGRLVTGMGRDKWENFDLAGGGTDR